MTNIKKGCTYLANGLKSWWLFKPLQDSPGRIFQFLYASSACLFALSFSLVCPAQVLSSAVFEDFPESSSPLPPDRPAHDVSFDFAAVGIATTSS